MAVKGVAFWVYYICLDASNRPLAGDLANHTVNISLDGAAAVACVNNQGGAGKHIEVGGGAYGILITTAEANYDAWCVIATSTTSGAAIVPRTGQTVPSFATSSDVTAATTTITNASNYSGAFPATVLENAELTVSDSIVEDFWGASYLALAGYGGIGLLLYQKLQTISGGRVTVQSPLTAGADINLTPGDDYVVAHGTQLTFLNNGNFGDLTGVTPHLLIREKGSGSTVLDIDGLVDGTVSSPTSVSFAMTTTETAALDNLVNRAYEYKIESRWSDGTKHKLLASADCTALW